MIESVAIRRWNAEFGKIDIGVFFGKPEKAVFCSVFFPEATVHTYFKTSQ